MILYDLQGAAKEVYRLPLTQFNAADRALLSGQLLGGNTVVVEAPVMHTVVEEVTYMSFEQVINTHHPFIPYY